MARIAADSKLPPASTPLRYSDFGLVRTVRHEADGYHIELDRVVEGDDSSLINDSPTTYKYVVPDSSVHRLVPAGSARKQFLAVGDEVQLTTDGYHVTSVTVLK
jgi:hypothetical protein